jgi:hypothetical protein
MLAEAPPFIVVTQGATYVDNGTATVIVPDDEPIFPVVSPDGRHLALTTEGDAISAPTLSIVASDSGQVGQSWEIDVPQISIREWAPDSSGLLAVAGDPAVGMMGVYRVDGTVDEVDTAIGSGTIPLWYVGPSATTWVHCIGPDPSDDTGVDCRGAAALVTSTDAPVLLFTELANDDRVGRFADPDQPLEPLEGVGASATQASACGGRFAMLATPSTGWVGVYDSDDGSVTPIPSDVTTLCPVVSPPGDSFAFGHPDGPIVVTADGTVTTVAREGTPVAFSADGQFVLVTDTVTLYRVPADGSGGAAAAVALGLGCAVGNGLVVGEGRDDQSGETLIYDVGGDTATPVQSVGGTPAAISRQQGDPCTVSDDGRWLSSDRSIIDLATATGLYLPDAVDGLEHTLVSAQEFAWVGGSYTAPVAEM